MEKFDESQKKLAESQKKIDDAMKAGKSQDEIDKLQKEADKKQKWPLLNLVRQVLHVYGYKMTPIRKCDGYTEDGIKRFKRYFSITKNAPHATN